MKTLIDDPDDGELMTDANHCKVRPHAAAAKDGNEYMCRAKWAQQQNPLYYEFDWQ